MTKAEKARKSFDYACKQASKCRHEKYQVSCFSCDKHKECDIRLRLEKAQKLLEY